MVSLIITSDFIRALGWTLLHSLWIGAGVFVLTVIGLILTQRSSSVVRYRMLNGCLLLFLFATVLNGLSLFKTSSSPATAHTSPVTITLPHNTILQWIDGAAGWLAGIWAIVLLFKTYKLCRSLKQLQQLRSSATLVSAGDWQDKLAGFSKRLQIPTTITFLESVKVTIPLTLGHFRPVIIVPAGFLFELPYAQVEAILFHELAHIYRKDYLFNMLQHIGDTLFFFNPGWVWLSGIIREQREMCCDDMVIAHTGNKTEYLKGLLAFELAGNSGSRLQLSVKGSPLARRLSRMIENKNRPFDFMPGILTLLLLLAIPVTVLLISKRKNASQIVTAKVMNPDTLEVRTEKVMPPVKRKRVAAVTKTKPKPKVRETPADTTFHMASIRFEKSNEDMANRIMTVKDFDGNIYHVQIAQNELVALSINKKVITEDQLPGYLGLLSRIDDAWNRKRAEKALAMAKLSADLNKNR